MIVNFDEFSEQSNKFLGLFRFECCHNIIMQNLYARIERMNQFIAFGGGIHSPLAFVVRTAHNADQARAFKIAYSATR
ncbi:hypothetical protein AL036_10465 [Salipiger aestuarii]|nr:hypothetical protein AL036_10465 [Salipiger aestuarii]